MVTLSDLLELFPSDAERQLRDLHAAALKNLLPFVGSSRALVLGPTFAGSHLCRADADWVADGCLFELKTRLGSGSGSHRHDSLPLRDIYQLLGYLLFDYDDAYEIAEVAYYSGRYGHLARWSAQLFVDELAGQHLELAEARERMRAVLHQTVTIPPLWLPQAAHGLLWQPLFDDGQGILVANRTSEIQVGLSSSSIHQPTNRFDRGTTR